MKNLSIILLLVIIVVVIVFVNLSPHPLSTVVLNSMSASETPQLIVPSVDKQTVSGKKCPRLDNGGWWEDRVYFEIVAKTFAVDCVTFAHFNSTYAKDINAVYFFAHSTTSPVVTAQIIEGADPASFTARAWAPFATDKQHVFFLDKLIPDADPATFFHIDPEELPSYFFY